MSMIITVMLLGEGDPGSTSAMEDGSEFAPGGNER